MPGEPKPGSALATAGIPETSPFTYTGGIFLPDALTGPLPLGGVPFDITTAGNAVGFTGLNS